MDTPTPRPGSLGPAREGDLLGARYRLGRVLGRGGTATVHAATDVVLHREVAVKVLAPGLGTGAGRADEALLLARVSHPHLVTLHDADLTGEPSYLVMELVPGPSLADRLREGGPLAADQVEALATQLGSALAYVHDRGMVHRDLKPANVLLAAPLPRGAAVDARLTDFGIARVLDAARLTATGTVLGTAAYLSPEQARGAAVGPPSDVYSLGLVLLEAATGDVAYPGPALESAAARLARPPVVPTSLPEPLRSLLTAMTSSDPARRPTAARVARLDPGTAPLPSATVPARTPGPADPGTPRTRVLDQPVTRALDPVQAPERPPRRLGLLLGLCALVVALVLGVVLLTRPGPTAPSPATGPSGPARTTATTAASAPAPTPAATSATKATATAPTAPTAPTTTTRATVPGRGPGSGHGGGPGPGKGGGHGGKGKG